jgi:hypothetical protein
MNIKSINISRRESYANKIAPEFTAKICLVGGSDYPADINIQIPPEMLDPIIGIVAQATAQAMTDATEAFHSEVKAMLVGPAIEQTAIADQVVEA